jgi:hypothetical protein
MHRKSGGSRSTWLAEVVEGVGVAFSGRCGGRLDYWRWVHCGRAGAQKLVDQSGGEQETGMGDLASIDLLRICAGFSRKIIKSRKARNETGDILSAPRRK